AARSAHSTADKDSAGTARRSPRRVGTGQPVEDRLGLRPLALGRTAGSGAAEPGPAVRAAVGHARADRNPHCARTGTLAREAAGRGSYGGRAELPGGCTAAAVRDAYRTQIGKHTSELQSRE